MKFNILIGLCAGLFAYGLVHAVSAYNAAHVKAFSFTDLNGQTHDVRDFKGKIIVLNFWASWCAPCKKEFPLLLDIAHDYPDDVVLVALSSDIDPQAIGTFLKTQENVAAPNIFISHDPNQATTMGKFGVDALPVTWIIDQKQQLKNELTGAAWTKDALTGIIDDLQN